jgi:hypothetical protein
MPLPHMHHARVSVRCGAVPPTMDRPMRIAGVLAIRAPTPAAMMIVTMTQPSTRPPTAGTTDRPRSPALRLNAQSAPEEDVLLSECGPTAAR